VSNIAAHTSVNHPIETLLKMKRITPVISLLLLSFLLFQCSVSKQIKEAKAFGNCKYRVTSADSVFLAGINIKEIRSFQNFDLASYPRLGLAFLRKNIPLDLVLNIDVSNPTGRVAAVNQVEYKILLAGSTSEGSELFAGILNQRIEVLPGTAPTRVPIHLTTNVYSIISNESSRNDFINLFQSLTGNGNTKPAKLLIKLKPTLSLGNQAVDYPGYITVQQEITSDLLTRQ
jgi:hypothetical protein